MIVNTEPTYLVGSYEDGEFWCRGEFTSKDKAEAAYYHYCKDQPQKHIQLVHQVKVHNILENYLPKHEN